MGTQGEEIFMANKKRKSNSQRTETAFYMNRSSFTIAVKYGNVQRLWEWGGVLDAISTASKNKVILISSKIKLFISCNYEHSDYTLGKGIPFMAAMYLIAARGHPSGDYNITIPTSDLSLLPSAYYIADSKRIGSMKIVSRSFGTRKTISMEGATNYHTETNWNLQFSTKYSPAVYRQALRESTEHKALTAELTPETLAIILGIGGSDSVSATFSTLLEAQYEYQLQSLDSEKRAFR